MPHLPIVEILAFVLMPNHFHLILQQKVDSGITKFMHKLGTGYTMYFNEKYSRVGHLFQGRFKAVLVEKDHHFLYLPHYIHLNPLDLMNVRGSTSNMGGVSDAKGEIGGVKSGDDGRWEKKMEFLAFGATQIHKLHQSYGRAGVAVDGVGGVNGNSRGVLVNQRLG